MDNDLERLRRELNSHIEQDLLPFWMSLSDRDNGGFYGEVSSAWEVKRQADKGCILNSRIMWFFSNSYIRNPRNDYLECARLAFKQCAEVFYDSEYGGVYWSVTYDGQPADTTKHTYNQAFAIYGLCAYYEATGDESALLYANRLYEIIEKKCRDERGYLEAFDRKWNPEKNEKLSENGVEAYRTMNTVLHIFEAYTQLYRITHGAEAGVELIYIADQIANHIYNPKLHRLDVFFDRDFNSILDLQSYGHDIEAAWLVEAGLDVLEYGDDRYDLSISERSVLSDLRRILNDLTVTVYERAYHRGLVFNECENGVDDMDSIWWVQCEAMIGFMNGYVHHPEAKGLLQAVIDIWESVKNRFIATAQTGTGKEWFWAVDAKGNIDRKHPIAGKWKCPYHNGRMCMELISRTDKIL